MKRILVVEPYYGGSHKNFLDGLKRNIDADFIFLTLPARKWKMRMQLSAPWFAECVSNMKDRCFDTVLSSTFVDVAVLKSLLSTMEDWNRECIFCTYFHENQFVYPNQINDPTLFHFTSINFNTALVSDRLAFNSKYNLQSFIDNSKSYVKKASDMRLNGCIDEIKRKSVVIYPGIDFTDIDTIPRPNNKEAPVICWNHRWEHDKGPELFFDALMELKKGGISFRLVVMGQSFANVPSVFAWAEEYFQDDIKYFGYIGSHRDYLSKLKECDIVVSTALHEFFGISVLEAVRAGCVPLIPDRLSYPELYPQEFLYKNGELASKLGMLVETIRSGERPRLPGTEKYCWQLLAPIYRKWLLEKY